MILLGEKVHYTPKQVLEEIKGDKLFDGMVLIVSKQARGLGLARLDFRGFKNDKRSQNEFCFKFQQTRPT